MLVNWKKSKDQNVGAYIVFAKAADSKLYKEAAYTNQLTEAELQENFKKGLLVVCVGDDEYAVPVHVNANKAYIVSASTTAAVTEWAALATPSTKAAKK